MWGGRLFWPLEDFFNREQADVVCLQEAISYTDGDNDIFLGSIERFAKNCGYQHVAFAPVFNFAYLSGRAQFGNAILSRHPLTDTEIVFTRGQLKPNFDFDTEDHNVRNFLRVKLSTPSGSYWVVTHHGHVVRAHKNGTAETDRQMELLADHVSKLDGKVILTGDFNLDTTSPSLKPINALMRNLTTEHKLKTTRSVLTKLQEPCDYIFTSNDVKVSSFKASSDLVSDHLALIAELE